MKQSRRFLMYFLLLMPMTLWADVSSDLDNYFQNLGYATNATDPHIYQGQAAGYYTGGSLFMRSNSRAMQIAHVDLPSLKAGCGGIDLFTGGASFVKGQELVDFGRDIMADAAPYAFQLALESYSPQIASVMSKLQYWSQEMNQNNLTSCQVSQDLIGGLWPKNTEAQRQVCQDLGVQGNAFSDWAAARQGCGEGGQGDSILNQYNHSANGEARITRNKNIVWESIEKDDLLAKDTQLAEFFMSLSGTIVFDSNGNPTMYPSLIDNTDLLSALMNGGEATIYQCKDTGKDDCLTVQTGKVIVNPDKALVYRINTLLINLQSNYQQDVGLTDEEKGFLNSTSLPVLKFIQVALESGNGLNTMSYAQIIAEDLLSQYLQGVIQLIQQNMEYAQDGDVDDRINQGLAKASTQVAELKSDVAQKIQAETVLINQSMQFQQQVAGQLSSKFQLDMNDSE